MVAKNDITGDSIQSKTNSTAYQNNYDLIFKKTPENKVVAQNEDETILDKEDRVMKD